MQKGKIMFTLRSESLFCSWTHHRVFLNNCLRALKKSCLHPHTFFFPTEDNLDSLRKQGIVMIPFPEQGQKAIVLKAALGFGDFHQYTNKPHDPFCVVCLFLSLCLLYFQNSNCILSTSSFFWFLFFVSQLLLTHNQFWFVIKCLRFNLGICCLPFIAQFSLFLILHS